MNILYHMLRSLNVHMLLMKLFNNILTLVNDTLTEVSAFLKVLSSFTLKFFGYHDLRDAHDSFPVLQCLFLPIRLLCL